MSVAEKEDCIEISVADHGIGIAPSDLARGFNRFERTVSGQHFSGLRLGLYIVSLLLEAHGGKIGVTSVIGKGSIFTVKLPPRVEKSKSKSAQPSEKMDFAVQYAKSSDVETRS